MLGHNKLKRQLLTSYEEIAGDFSKTRFQTWPEIEIIKKEIAPGSHILDIGCGNGRLFAICKDLGLNYVGIDFSKNLIKEAQKLHPEAEFKLLDFTQDLRQLKDTYDYLISIAALHHIPSKKIRIKVLKELKSLLKPHGKLMFTVWNLHHGKYWKYLLRARILNFGRYGWNDCFIPWKGSGAPILRYYHAFSERELRKLLKKAGFEIKLLSESENGHNFIVVAA